MSKGTPKRSIRVEDELWNHAQAAADERNENLSTVLRDHLSEYAGRNLIGAAPEVVSAIVSNKLRSYISEPKSGQPSKAAGIEAAAKAIHRTVCGGMDDGWFCGTECRGWESYKEQARAALEAALPHMQSRIIPAAEIWAVEDMLKEAKSAAWDEGAKFVDEHIEVPYGGEYTNPYRRQP